MKWYKLCPNFRQLLITCANLILQINNKPMMANTELIKKVPNSENKGLKMLNNKAPNMPPPTSVAT